ncbi:ergosterol biosynthetic protein 28 isoform X1 [Durio zibethinus]|uniref:Ergosterol biosynthetic protein 28 isoform X1 n=1 Tax=Durio zibethinus TaxID=66656 RepID=A0A6P6B508_DURZI|nr:ergosterol biosynthetic protein 28 isoform X1 [Durio zibethinus]XP_022772957.1 ergosterol biosynthetic protein 28 isoform X1 [Durio zibethinus]
MKALGWWLMLVGSLRLASVWFGFFDIWALRLAVFSNTTMTEVHGRTFGVWTLLTCTLCFLCALNLENKPLYLVTFLSFIYAFGHFLTEYLFYHTMALSNLTTVGIFAGMVFMSKHAILLSLLYLVLLLHEVSLKLMKSFPRLLSVFIALKL